MYSREIIEEVKHAVIKEAMGMREFNKVAPVSGERIDIPCKGRLVNVVYYKTKKENAPLVFAYHGGGFLFGGNALNDAMWKAVRDKLDVNVTSVEYRKSPEYQYEAALEDASEVAHYMVAHAEEFGFDPNQISVMGCSAGAGLAATLCIYEKKRHGLQFQNQILMYPYLDSDTDPDAKGKGSLEGPIMYVFTELHCKPEETKLPEVSPVFATSEDLTGLPHSVFCLCENDNLKHEGYRYAEMLEKVGVSCDVQEFKEMPHGFFESGFGKITEEEMDFLGEDVKAMVRSGKIAKVSKEALDFVAQHFVME